MQHIPKVAIELNRMLPAIIRLAPIAADNQPPIFQTKEEES
jgi:hypothetical protein